MEVHRLSFSVRRVTEICVCGAEIPYHKRAIDSVAFSWVSVAVNRESVKIRKIFNDTMGACYYSNSTNLQVEAGVEEECGTEKLIWQSFAALDPDTTKRC